MATKTTTKKTTTTKKAALSDKKTNIVKKTISTKKAATKSVDNKTTKKVDLPKKEESTTLTSIPVRHERQFGQNKFYTRRKKFCKLCAKGIEHVDYKDIELLSKYLNHNMKISSRKQTSACASHQRRISNAIKRARIVALIHCVKD